MAAVCSAVSASCYLSQAVVLGEGLVGRILELLRNLTRPPSQRVVLDLRKHKGRMRSLLWVLLHIYNSAIHVVWSRDLEAFLQLSWSDEFMLDQNNVNLH